MELLAKGNSYLYYGDDYNLYYRKGRLSLASRKGEIHSFALPLSLIKRIGARFRITDRLFRLAPRTAIRISNDEFLVSYNGVIYLVNARSKQMKEEHHFAGIMNNPLSFTRITGVEGFEDCITYGEYMMNPNKHDISLWTRDRAGVWSSKYTFKGNITHIHAIVPDVKGKCVYILTGDFGDEAAIWKATKNFKVVEPVVKGEQIFRGCVAFATANGLLYATDTPMEQNGIYLLQKNTAPKKLHDLPGPCIYGTEKNGIFYFATSVEPDSNLPTWKYFLSRKPGPGVKDRYTYVIAGNEQSGFREVAKFKKDCLPFTLFQFGNVMFPQCDVAEKILLQPIAVKKFDNCALFL